MRGFSAIALFMSFLLIAGCSVAPSKPPHPPKTPAVTESTAFVMSNGWHSSIVLPRAVLPPNSILESKDFPQALYLEFGWGDAEYYPAATPTIGMTLRAGFLPTRAVVHIAALRREPSGVYPAAEVIALALDAEALQHLIAYIDESFDRAGAARAKASGPGLYPDSRFYPARGRFHLANTCNTWTARALVAAGLSVDETEAVRAEGLMSQVRSMVD